VKIFTSFIVTLSLYCHFITLESRPLHHQRIYRWGKGTLLSLYCFGVEAFTPPEDLPVGEGDIHFIVTLLFWTQGLHCHNERGLI
jgi:hypothetical protein